jgi:hypothetical protein
MEFEPELATRVGEALFCERHADAGWQALGEVIVKAARARVRGRLRHAERMPSQARLHVARQIVERAGELRHPEK